MTCDHIDCVDCPACDGMGAEHVGGLTCVFCGGEGCVTSDRAAAIEEDLDAEVRSNH